ncbi:MAG: acyl-CoA dehydratase activase [Tepidisphaerales bacterium]
MTTADQKLCLGFDCGSVALKVVVTDASGAILHRSYARTRGRPIETALESLGQVIAQYGPQAFDLVAGTGSAGRLICQLLDLAFANEVICQARAIRQLAPNARTLLEMGGQDSKLVILPEPGTNGRLMVDFSMNTNCAAGTGSFLDQQASRLGISIEEEFGRLALMSKSPPRVAGRCSVFAKSDMIHLQQQATPLHDIVAGLCLGLARNLKSNLGRATELPRPIAFCGGVAANLGVVQAIRTAFELVDGQLIVPELHACTGALGAILIAREERARRADYARPPAGRLDLSGLSTYLSQSHTIGHRLDALARPHAVPPVSAPAEAGGPQSSAAVCDATAPAVRKHGPPDISSRPNGAIPTRRQLEARAATGLIDVWLGVDVGSISTKAAVVDADNQVLAKIYLMTAGRPLDAVERALREIGRQVDGLVRIRGAATTGSGRYLTGDVIGADLVINEITAQATAAAAIDPQVDTIFEIGGQDSKYISLDKGVVVDFEMNHACAAGTGSFLEEQAERLGVNIKEQFAELAFASKSPIRLGERCTVFMESDLLNYQQQGARTDDLVAGLCHSIVANYVNRVVGRRRIGNRIFFQGGTAFNGGVVAAFERFTGRTITVPPHHEVTGAIGAALLARRFQEQIGRPDTNFGGFDLSHIHYEVNSFECKHCSNACEINEVRIPGRATLAYGSRCDRYNVRKDTADNQAIPNLFVERLKLLLRHARVTGAKRDHKTARATIGLPLCLSNYQLLPLWGALFDELGFNMVVTPASTHRIVQRGVEAVLSTPCFPVKVAHGHVLELMEKGVDFVWMPSLISMPQDYADNRYNQLCPYVTAIPYQVAAAVAVRGQSVKILMPPVRLQDGAKGVLAALTQVRRDLGIGRNELRRAVAVAWQAQQNFEQACRDRGREVLASLRPGHRTVVVISRPYNGCDAGVSLDLPNKLRRLGVLPIPMDFLDLREPAGSNADRDRVFGGMYWKYGQRILRAADIIRHDPRLNAIYLANFSCGPDSFLLGYFKRVMAPKPSLILEVDEHSADAGVVTRLEAFLESLGNARTAEMPRRLPLYPHVTGNGQIRTLYMPWMGDQAHAMAAAFSAHGQPTEVIPMGDEQSLELGRRHCSGKECLPCIITTGDMVKVTQRPGFDPSRAAFFMPGGSGPCRFGQYCISQGMVLSDLGMDAARMFSPSHDENFYDEWKHFDGDPIRLAWAGICAVDAMLKACCEVRPYETNPGQTDGVYQRRLGRVCDLIRTRPRESRIAEELRLAADEFRTIPVDRSRPRPRIGIVGEIYVRHHSFANNDLVRQLESLGAQADLASFQEYIYYSNWSRQGQAWRAGSLRHCLVNAIKNRVQRGIQRRMSAPFAGLIDEVDEAPTSHLLKLASPYLDPSFEGEAILSIGKMIEFHHHGRHGVVNVMPFTCMPSTIVGGVMKKVAGALGQMPTLSISYDGQQDATLHTRLEAFVHQARTYQAKHKHP